MIFNPLNENAIYSNEKFNYNSTKNIAINNKCNLFRYNYDLNKIYGNNNNIFNQLLNKIFNNNISIYVKYLNDKTFKNNSQLNEKQIFDKYYNLMYEYLISESKLNFFKLTNTDFLKNNTCGKSTKINTNLHSKEHLKRLKDIYSIIVNNSNFSLQIFKK